MESKSLTKEFRALSKASSPRKENCKQTAVNKLNYFGGKMQVSYHKV